MIRQYPDHEQVEEALYQQGIGEIKLERNQGARKTLDTFVSRYPTSKRMGEAYYWLGILADKNNDLKVAETYLKAAIRVTTNTSVQKRTLYLVPVLQKQKKYVEAADTLQPLIQTSIEIPSALLEWLARYRLQHKAYPQAQEASEHLVQTTRKAIWKQIGFYLQGMSMIHQGQLKRAEKALKQALEADVKTREGVQAALKLGEIKLANNELVDAVTYFEKAGEGASTSEYIDLRVQSYYGLGKIAAEKEDWQEAGRYFMSVAILFDDTYLSPESLYKAAQAFGHLGKLADKRRALKELFERYPDSEWTKISKPVPGVSGRSPNQNNTPSIDM